MKTLQLNLIVTSMIMCVCSLATAYAPKGMNLIPGLSVIQPGLHIRYSTITRQPPVPKSFLDQHIAELDQKIKEASGQPGGQGVAKTNEMFKADWQKRYVGLPPETGKAEYWGTPNAMMWSDGSSAYAYNGKYTTSGRANDIIPSPYDAKQRPEWLHVRPGNQDIELIVPYLGFDQPGKLLFQAKRISTKQTNIGTESIYSIKEDGRTTIEFIAKYDKHNRLLTLQKLVEGTMMSSASFGDMVEISKGIIIPKRVECTQYVPYAIDNKPTSFKYMIVVYTAKNIQVTPLDKAIFDVQHPRAGVVVQDWRYKSDANPDGVQYKYINPKLSIDESSAMTARQQKPTTSSTGWITLALRLVSFAIVLLVIGRIIMVLVKREAPK